MAQSKTKQVLKPTTLADIKAFANGELVELPSFIEGASFVARMRRPSLQSMAKSGKIPNTLLVKANELFFRGQSNEDVDMEDIELLPNSYELYHIVAEASLIEPSLAEIEDAGLELTDQQLIAIYNYSQLGIYGLEPFRS